MYKFSWRRLIFNLVVTALFLLGFNILLKEIGPTAALGVGLIGLSAIINGQFAERFGGRVVKLIRNDKEKQES